MLAHTKAWELWFERNFPAVDRFIYFADKSSDYKTDRELGTVGTE